MTRLDSRGFDMIKMHCAYYRTFSLRLSVILWKMDAAEARRDYRSLYAYRRELAAVNECLAMVRLFMLNLSSNYDQQSIDIIAERLFTRASADELGDSVGRTASTAYRMIDKAVKGTIDKMTKEC